VSCSGPTPGTADARSRTNLQRLMDAAWELLEQQWSGQQVLVLDGLTLLGRATAVERPYSIAYWPVPALRDGTAARGRSFCCSAEVQEVAEVRPTRAHDPLREQREQVP
jgi:hypothetical protein